MANRRGAGVAPSAGLWLVVGLAAYGGAAAALLLYDPLASVAMPVPVPEWVPLVAPPLVYVLLALVGLARQSLMRALLGAVALCAGYGLLMAGTEALRTIVLESLVPTPSPGALQALALTCLQLVSVPVLLAPFRAVLAARPRQDRTGRTALPRTAGPRGRVAPMPPAPSASSGRSGRTAWSSSPSSEPVAAPSGRDGRAEAPKASVGTPESPPAPPVPASPSASPSPSAPPPTGARPPGAEPFEGVVRIPFERVAAQLPAEIFRIKPDRVGENLLEPGFLLVPQRLLTPQLAEGAVQVGWEIVADQFPRQALALSDAEITRRIPNGKLVLPVDEVVRQLPTDLFVLPSPTVDVRGIEEFPAPFQPHFPPPSEEPRPEAEPQPEPPRVARIEEPRPVGPVGVEVRPAVSPSEPPPKREPVPAPARADVVAVPGVGEPDALGQPALTHDAQEPELPELAPLLARLKGQLEVHDSAQGGIRFLTIVRADVAGGAVAATAGRIAPLLIDARLPEPVRQATLRGGAGAVVLTPLGAVDQGGPVLVVAVSSRSSLAMLERLSLRAAADHREKHAGRAPSGGRGAGKGGAAALVDATVPAQVRAVAESTSAFGSLTPAVLRDPTGSTLVYLFRSRSAEAGPLGQFASDLWGALREAEIGPPSSVVLRMDAHSVAVRDLATRGGTTIVVIEGGRVERPGLAYIELDRAAARLGALTG